MTKTLSLALALSIAFVSTPARADHHAATPPATPAAAARAEIEGALGFLPTFIKAIPDPLLPGMWDQIKSFEMNPKTALDNRTKELIGLAVASQIPCDYCVYSHTAAAKAEGATDQQIAEAVGMAALTRAGSTLMHGAQVDLVGFKKEVDRMYKKK